MKLYFDYGRTGEALGSNFEVVATLEDAHEILKTKPDSDYAFVIESDLPPRGRETDLSEFREVYDRAGGWRKPNPNARFLQELWEE